MVERRLITLVPIIVTTTTTTTTIAAVGVSTSTSVSPGQSTTTTSSPATSSSPIRALQEREIIESINSNDQNVWNLSLPVYVNNQLPEATPSIPIAIQSGSASAVDVAIINEQAVQLGMEDGFSVRVTALDDDGNVSPLAPNGAVRAKRLNQVFVTGQGFKPGTQAVVWIFSNPRRLGVIQVGATGSYSSQLQISSAVELGEHTLQVNGVIPDGNVRSMNIGIEIVENYSLPGDDNNSDQGVLNSTAEVLVLYTILLVILGSSGYLLVSRKRRRDSSRL